MTNPPPVAPVEGHYALLRNGDAVGLIKKYQTKITYPYLFTSHLPHMNWTESGVSDWDDGQYDIIATISPEAMKLAANPELIGDLIKDAFDTSPEYKTLNTLIKKMLGENERLRAALKAAEDKQCASCRHCDSFGLSAALQGDAP